MKRSLILITAGIVLVGAACASDDDDAAAPATTVTAPSPSEAPVATQAPTTTAAPPAPTTLAPPPPTTPPTNAVRQEQLRAILESHRAAGEFVGARISLREPDGTVTEVTSGTQSVDPGSPPVDATIPWNIGSSTKAFVAVVALQLAEEGRLDLDAPIAGFFPDLPGADQITPRQLLQHTSGLGEYLDDPAVQGDLAREWAPAELIAVAEAAGRSGEPGGPHRYANTNYIALGEVIRQVTGNPWYDEVRTRIAEPLGMTATSYPESDRPVGYRIIDGTFVDWTFNSHPSIGGATGALQSTGRDLLLFATALRDGTLLSPESRAAMEAFVPAEDLSQFGIDHSYGLGLERYGMDGMTIIGHLGTGQAQNAYVGYHVETGTTVAVQTNTATSGPQGIMALETLTAAAA
jgi:D-alanyl-D-alanine carboxypeptidase